MVENVDAARIVVRQPIQRISNNAVDIYNLTKYTRSNQNTLYQSETSMSFSWNDKVKCGILDILSDGPSVDNGELALGQNIRIDFMPWNGYNF